MKEEYSEGVPSTAAIGGHPLHPVLVTFPIAFLIGGLASDLAYWRTDDTFWARASLWLIATGVVTGLFAAIFGFIDFATIRRARSAVGWTHFLGNLTAVLLSALNVWLRLGNVEGAIMPWGLGLSVLVGLILLVTGWLGGELTFRYKIGMVEGRERRETRTGTTAQRPIR